MFGREFLARYSPWPIEHVSLETRVGRPEEYILPVAREMRCDVIALAWGQELTPGRASIVRDTLQLGTIPIVLVGQGLGRGSRRANTTPGVLALGLLDVAVSGF
jgi:hypothetical protein